MSKNVAVFVDVANIFYAAKAAGVDIDYVTLLRAAVSGRDFVRAYAYTGLDPENENQRQFHSFLARNGYKVVSKDIRKYGDGKVKANLDIELVVDMMKTARNLDVAVVVSGDGDFAPAIRAVQEMGVRVEVISFRGNTSSDLIEVADVFTDITQIARVERGSSRSGRRVAAGDEDLSMTEVPDKETEGAPRRRRGRTRPEVVAERPVERAPARRAVADAPVAHGPLVVLPGEKLKRAVPAVASDEPAIEETGSAVGLDDEEEAGPEAAADQAAGDQAAGEAGHRRRRRRGGRGRGRGRGVEGVTEAGVEAPVEEAAEEDEDEIRPAPRIPAHSTFGSVWDSQLGMPSAPATTGGDLDVGEDEEPEIPEYLLAERRQRARGGRGHGRGGGGARSAYQQAMDRERYGRGGGPAGPVTGPRRDQRDRGGRPGGPGRPDRNRQSRPASFEARPAPGGDPWTEVPPELEEMLRAELARKGGPGPRADASPASGATDALPQGRPAAADRGAGRGRGGPRGGRTAASPAGTQPADVAAPLPAAGAAAGVSTPSVPEGGAPPPRRGRPPAVAAPQPATVPAAAGASRAVAGRRRAPAAAATPTGSSGEAAPVGDSPVPPLALAAAPGRRATGGPAAPGRQRRTVAAHATGAAEPAPEPPAPRRRGRAASGGESDVARGTGTEAATESPAAASRRGRAAPRAVAQPPAASDAPDAAAPRKRVTRRAPSAPAE